MSATDRPEADRHPVPDQRGANLYATDPGLHDLLRVYLPAPVLGWTGTTLGLLLRSS